MSARFAGQKVPVSQFLEMGKVAGTRFLVLRFPNGKIKVSPKALALGLHKEIGVPVGYMEGPINLCELRLGAVPSLAYAAKVLATLQQDHPEMVPGFRHHSSI